jgi:hypothetical protein
MRINVIAFPLDETTHVIADAGFSVESAETVRAEQQTRDVIPVDRYQYVRARGGRGTRTGMAPVVPPT